MSREFEFIADLRKNLLLHHKPNSRLVIPPGDDTAELKVPETVLYAADMLMDQVHFKIDEIDPKLAGRKALAVNISDIAAMAGTPSDAVVSLAIPKQRKHKDLGELVMAGVIDLAREFNVTIAGGDTNSWDGPLVISVAILGHPHTKKSVQRSGAKPGDWIFVTGHLGGSILGKHLSFTPRVAEATYLHTHYSLHSMMDLSDGLSGDIRHILSESEVGAKLTKESIPISPNLHNLPPPQKLQHALSDGEDFELLFTLSPEMGKKLVADQPFAPELMVTKIGEITETESLVWEDGSEIHLTGFRHSF